MENEEGACAEADEKKNVGSAYPESSRSTTTTTSSASDSANENHENETAVVSEASDGVKEIINIVRQAIPHQGEEAKEETSKLKPTNEKKRAGYAAIKPEYLLHDYKPTLHSEYLSEKVKKEFGDVLSKSDKSEGVNLGKHPRSQDHKGEEDGDNDIEQEEGGEPSTKKAKLKGRNKQRPKYERLKNEDKLCPSIKAGRECKFGDNCKFIHDKKDFMDKKLPDLNQPCPIFERFGFCRSGISCRYAKSHLTEQLEDIVNQELYDKMKDSLTVLNFLPDDVKHKLWKRKFDFRKAMRAVKSSKKSTDPSNSKNGETSCADAETKEHASNESAESCKKDDNNSHPSKSQVTQEVQSCTVDKTFSETEAKVDVSVKEIQKEVPLSGENNDESSEFVVNEGKAKMDCTSKTTIEDKRDIEPTANVRTLGDITDEEMIRLRLGEKKKIDFKNKLYLAPLTTVGNLPFRRVCKGLGADITCGEMALDSQLLKAKPSEWSLIKRHPCEDLFGVQVCGSYPDMMAKCAQVLVETATLDFIDINCGCPIDMIFQKGAGSALMGRMSKLEQISRSMIGVMDGMPLTVKIRTGVHDSKHVAHTLIPRLRDAGVSLVTLHGRSREQRYTRQADWEYISRCANVGAPMPVFGNGDILSYEEANLHMESSGVSGVMIARGALIKPWIFTEIKEQRHWDISSNERYDILKSFSNYGLEHWGSDQHGVENTRRFLLEWLSFLHRYIPVGVLEQAPQKINERPPYYIGRNDLETMMASANCADWIKLSEMLLGPVPPTFRFLPKHKANAYQ